MISIRMIRIQLDEHKINSILCQKWLNYSQTFSKSVIGNSGGVKYMNYEAQHFKGYLPILGGREGVQ